MCCAFVFFFFCKQKTAYEMRISDWSSDVCSSDLLFGCLRKAAHRQGSEQQERQRQAAAHHLRQLHDRRERTGPPPACHPRVPALPRCLLRLRRSAVSPSDRVLGARDCRRGRSEEHTSELQSLMRISSAVFCLKQKN